MVRRYRHQERLGQGHTARWILNELEGKCFAQAGAGPLPELVDSASASTASGYLYLAQHRLWLRGPLSEYHQPSAHAALAVNPDACGTRHLCSYHRCIPSCNSTPFLLYHLRFHHAQPYASNTPVPPLSPIPLKLPRRVFIPFPHGSRITSCHESNPGVGEPRHLAALSCFVYAARNGCVVWNAHQFAPARNLRQRR